MDLVLSNPIGGLNLQVLDTSQAWANSAAANTTFNLDVTLPSLLQKDALYVVTVTNPSTVTALSVSFKNKHTLGAVARYPKIGGTQSVPANSPDGIAFVVQGFLLGEAARITLSNDTVLGASDAFTAYVHVRAA